jgi:hypothetical protein
MAVQCSTECPFLRTSTIRDFLVRTKSFLRNADSWAPSARRARTREGTKRINSYFCSQLEFEQLERWGRFHDTENLDLMYRLRILPKNIFFCGTRLI